MAMTNPHTQYGADAGRASAQYQQNAILNAKPERLVPMLFTGAVKFIRQADQALEKGNFPGAHQALVRAQDIVSYLQTTLNTDYEIARNLDALYTYILERLVQANLQKDRAVLAEAGRMVEELRETWMQTLSSGTRSKE
jgi:flagellar protein FliS